MLLLAFAGSAFAATSTMPSENLYLAEVTGTSLLPSAINAGDTVSLAVDILNTGINLKVTDLNAWADLGDYFESITGSAQLDSINPGVTSTLILKFKVNDNVQSGFYPVLVRFNYMRDGEQISQKVSVVVPVETGQKSLSIEVNPKSINPGNQSDLNFSITNNGSDSASNVLLSWTEENNLVLPVGSDNRKFVPSLAPGQTVQVSYTVAADPNITTGIYPINASVSYANSSGAQSQESTIGIIVGGTTDFQISVDALSTGQLSFSIANVGSNNASAVVISLPNQPGLTISGSSTVISGNLNKGDYTVANFTATAASSDKNFASSGGFGSRGATRDANYEGTGASVALTEYAVDIYYTDTTGQRQHVQEKVNAPLGSATGAASALASRNSSQQSPIIMIAAAFAVLLVGAAIFNKFKAKKSWKKFVIIMAVGIIVPAVIVLFVPNGFASAALAVAVLVAAIIYLFMGQKK